MGLLCLLDKACLSSVVLAVTLLVSAAVELVRCLQVLFATDMLPEAQAAQAAGWQAVLVVRPGNKPLPDNHGFRVVESMQELLQQ
jgi:methionine salvage enolase-phosphatase E1